MKSIRVCELCPGLSALEHVGCCMHRWHDFFRVEDVLVPWSQGREAVEGVACRRMGFQDIDELLHRHFSFSWNDVDAMGAHKVRSVTCTS
jgi:hypothetical protein